MSAANTNLPGLPEGRLGGSGSARRRARKRALKRTIAGYQSDVVVRRRRATLRRLTAGSWGLGRQRVATRLECRGGNLASGVDAWNRLIWSRRTDWSSAAAVVIPNLK